MGVPSTQASNAVIYVLQPATAAAAGGQPASWALAVDIPDASDALDTRRIALVKADKDFEMLVIPGSNHGAAESPYGNRRPLPTGFHAQQCPAR